MKFLKVALVLIQITATIGIIALLNTGCAKTTKPTQSGKNVTLAPVVKQASVGNPYPLSFCPVGDAELGSMGEPIAYNHNGRDLQFCCENCIDNFQADPEKYLKEVDAQIIAEQLPNYPIDTCLVSSEMLGGEMGEAINYVHNNTLVRFCCKGCIKDFKADPDKYMAKLK